MWALVAMLAGPAAAASAGVPVDRTVLPIAEPKPPDYTEAF